jgi:hypothetical protein
MADDVKISGEKLKVFISYSRRDAADFVARNPCLRRGPLSLDYWTRLPIQFWRSLYR